MGGNWTTIRRKGLRFLAWLAGIVVILWGFLAVWTWYLNRPPHYTFAVPPLPIPNALDDFHDAADAIAGRKALGIVYPNWYRHALEGPQKNPWYSLKEPPPPPLVPRESVRAFLQQNTESLRLIHAGFTHDYAIPSIVNESYKPYDSRHTAYYNWKSSCRELLEIRALYTLGGNNPREAADAVIDFLQYNVVTRRLYSYNFAELRPLASHLSLSDLHAITERLAECSRAHCSYAEATWRERLEYLNYITASFRDGYQPDWAKNRWNLCVGLLNPSPSEDRGLLRGLWYAYTIPNAQVPARADRYLTACAVAAAQPCSSHAPFPTPPPDPYNYTVFGWDQREKTRVAWALQNFKGDALLLTYALAGYRKVHGAYPPTLQPLLTDGWLPALPVDAFTLRDTICYMRTKGGYALYSRGPDGKDDGGRSLGKRVGPHSTGDVVFGITDEAEANTNAGRL